MIYETSSMASGRGDVPRSLPNLSRSLSPKHEGGLPPSPLATGCRSPKFDRSQGSRSPSPFRPGSASPNYEGLTTPPAYIQLKSPLAESNQHLWAHGHQSLKQRPKSPLLERRTKWRQCSDGQPVAQAAQYRRRLVLKTIHRSWPSSGSKR